MNENELIGKQFVIYNINNTILIEFIIKYVKTKTIPTKTYKDGSHVIGCKEIWVSKNNSGWYKYFDNYQGEIKK